MKEECLICKAPLVKNNFGLSHKMTAKAPEARCDMSRHSRKADGQPGAGRSGGKDRFFIVPCMNGDNVYESSCDSRYTSETPDL